MGCSGLHTVEHVLAGRNGELVVQVDAAKQGIQEMVSIWAGTGDF